MRIELIDPSAYTPPYDHALASALGQLGAQVQLLTSRFQYGPVPAPQGYLRRELFYPRSHSAAAAAPRSRARLALKLAEHVPGMLACRAIAQNAHVAHYQWLPVAPLDVHLLPRRTGARPPALLLTAHDVLPREPRPGQLRAQRRAYRHFDAIVVHSQHGASRLVHELGVDAQRVHAIPHGAFQHLAQAPPSPPPFHAHGPVILFFGLLRPYKGLDLLLSAWRELAPSQRHRAELWIAGMARMSLDTLDLAQDGVRVVPRFITDAQLPAYFQRADLVVLPYRQIDQSGVLSTALAFGKPLLLSDVGGFPEIAATGAALTFPAGDVHALAQSLATLISDASLRARLARAARTAAAGPYSWEAVAAAHLQLYSSLLPAA
ncbi:MAG: glycosyltransferase family 4 protein [Solirubrobacteraceae bacterium]